MASFLMSSVFRNQSISCIQRHRNKGPQLAHKSRYVLNGNYLMNTFEYILQYTHYIFCFINVTITTIFSQFFVLQFMNTFFKNLLLNTVILWSTNTVLKKC